MICEMCGKEFEADKAGAACRGQCGMGSHCAGVRCPYCYYEMVPEPGWITGLKRLMGGKPRNGAADTAVNDLPLSKLSEGRRALVSRIDTRRPEASRKLIAIGMLPGSELQIVQKYPAYVVKMGESQFSIDAELASLVYVSAN